jgi:hypothetical protein
MLVVPRDMTKAVFYNSILECDELVLVIECLNGYRLKRNHLIMVNSRPIGVVETMKEGADIL